jgi:hypothetical protein
VSALQVPKTSSGNGPIDAIRNVWLASSQWIQGIKGIQGIQGNTGEYGLFEALLKTFARARVATLPKRIPCHTVLFSESNNA